MPWAAACRASRTGAAARGTGSRRVPRDAPRTGLAGACWWSREWSEWTWMCWSCSDYWRCSLHSRLQDSQAPGGACEESRGTCARRARWSWGRCARSRLRDESGTRASSRPSFSWMDVYEQMGIISIVQIQSNIQYSVQYPYNFRPKTHVKRSQKQSRTLHWSYRGNCPPPHKSALPVASTPNISINEQKIF